MKSPYTDSLAHTTYECKYHIVLHQNIVVCSTTFVTFPAL